LIVRCWNGNGSLVSLSFGETDAYETYSFLFGLRWWICKNLRVALPLARGIGPTLWPLRVPLHCVVGTPIRVTKSSNPSDMTVTHLHTRFTAELKALFDKHKAACGHPNAELVVH
jgi:2-acylglycerol O-acyltransferase 2